MVEKPIPGITKTKSKNLGKLNTLVLSTIKLEFFKLPSKNKKSYILKANKHT